MTIFSRSGIDTGPVIRDVLDEELRKLNDIETTPPPYLREFDRQVQADVFFDELVSSTRDALVSLQFQIKHSEAEKKERICSRTFCLKGIFQPFELGGVTRLIRSAVKFWKAGN